MQEASNSGSRQALLLGLGLDNEDQHVRITRGEEFVLLGGSQNTHQQMQETAVRVSEEIARRGKRMADLSKDEFVEIVNDARGR